ncbi:MAG: DUF1573 domain-containing protein [Bacteroidetes bacterium]|nr:MAG: DUF1573 domain-containing protein [Bacteroidota bacterium]
MSHSRVFLLLAVLCISLTAYCQSPREILWAGLNPRPAASAPVVRMADISSDRETRHLGPVLVGEEYVVEFWLYNNGASALRITGVASTCAKGVRIERPDEIPVNGKARLRIYYTPQRTGNSTFYVTVAGNFPELSKVLTVKSMGITEPLGSLAGN